MCAVMEDLNVSALEFVSFCHRRCGQEWPELYDEMCRVAGRRLYRGMGYYELNNLGIPLDLANLDNTLALVDQYKSNQKCS
ncbi:hypothetical protein [Dehalococcoides mccartyi]|uniref:Uncharacterized protein n=2 Tax=Dehalococcoides mccartyi TaxID=61435 RepID=D2BGL6_DEHMV|nr:hypothetical protein DhcVS_307 [Dehalococcoides mccartyi VS]